MNSDEIKSNLVMNAEEISRLQACIYSTLPYRSNSPEQKVEWEKACAEFHSRYNHLSFPGGYSTAIERICAGDEETIEAALCFLECRPYFFRSGYMWNKILKKIKRAVLSMQQTERLKIVMQKHIAWRASKHDI